MMTAVVQQNTSPDSQVTKQQVPPSVLLIGKKRTLDYVAPALYRINDTGELVIRATGSLSIVTAVDVAEIVKRDMDSIATQSITVGTDELRIATGELKRMSCIEIHLIKVSPLAVAPPVVDFHVPVEEPAASPIEIPIEEATSPVEVDVPVIVVEKAKKPRAKRKSPAAKKKSSKKKKKAVSA
jgi:DNA-binding protein Alba